LYQTAKHYKSNPNLPLILRAVTFVWTELSESTNICSQIAMEDPPPPSVERIAIYGMLAASSRTLVRIPRTLYRRQQAVAAQHATHVNALNQRCQPMAREKILVVRGEIWALFPIFMFIILFHYIMLFQTSSNKYHTNNLVIIKQVHFILIKWNFYDHYFIDVCTFFKKFMLVVRGIQYCEFCGP
jgi:hypothetical protein